MENNNLLGDEAFGVALRHTLMFALEHSGDSGGVGLALAALVTAAWAETPTMRLFCLFRGHAHGWRCPLSDLILSREGICQTRCSGGWEEGSAWLKSLDTALAGGGVGDSLEKEGYGYSVYGRSPGFQGSLKRGVLRWTEPGRSGVSGP